MCKGEPQDEAYTSPFDYVIVQDKVMVDYDDPAYTHRNVIVLLDSKAFSEETLRQLFALLSKRFRSPDRLTVDVYTNIEQVDTPEEREAGKIFFESSIGAGKPSPKELNLRKYPYAILIRQNGNELFRYKRKVRYSKLKTVVLKGKDL